MTIEEIINKIETHMWEGILIHNAMAETYDFLGLRGYARFHNYQTYEEMCGMMHLSHYYFTHYHKLIKKDEFMPQPIIPDSWYKYTSMDVDASTKRNAIKDLTEKWINWERETKTLYQSMRLELNNIGEVAAALELDKYIIDVSTELEHAERELIKLNSIGYDLVEIESWQEQMSKKYKKKLGW